LIRAFQEAKAHNLPVDSYWIRAGNQFAMYIARSDQQVTRLTLRPSVRYEPLPGEQAAAAVKTPGDAAPIWIIKRGGGAST
jgi:hypothetical protein